MKKIVKRNSIAHITGNMVREDALQQRLYWAAAQKEEALLAHYDAAPTGLTQEQAERSREEWGRNTLTYGKREPVAKRLFSAFINPFTVILLALAVISAVTDIALASPGEENYATVLIIATMVLLSGGLRFVQETRSGNVADKLLGMLHTTACVEREGQKAEIPLEELVVGDLVHLSAGDMIPADLRILGAKDLFVSQSALTGESEAVEKLGDALPQREALTDTANLAFLGSNVVSGSAKALVLAVGNDTMLGRMAKELNTKPPKTTFEKGVNSVSWVLIRFMLLMVPVVLFVNGFTKGDWMQAALFAISVAVGLTPEMLPMIVTTSLAKGALAMSKQKVILKNLNAIQDLGRHGHPLHGQDRHPHPGSSVVLEYPPRTCTARRTTGSCATPSSTATIQTGLRNLMDLAAIRGARRAGTPRLPLWQEYTGRWTKSRSISPGGA